MAVLGALLLFFGARTIINIAFEEHERKARLRRSRHRGREAWRARSRQAATRSRRRCSPRPMPAKGAEVAKKCGLCHNFDKGGPNMIGPNLYGVLGRKIASHEGYEYSDALKAKGGNWDYEKINQMIEQPQRLRAGDQDGDLSRACPTPRSAPTCSLFLRTKNDNPPPCLKRPPATTPAPPEAARRRRRRPPHLQRAEAISWRRSPPQTPRRARPTSALCKVCHTFNKGGATLVGPDLYGVVGRKIASVEGFNYTPALKAHEGDWTFDKLDAWLTNPAAFAPGTMMAFPGIPDTKKRADVIAYLNANSDSPLPLPKAAVHRLRAAETPRPHPARAGGACAAASGRDTPPHAAPEATPSAETPPHLRQRQRLRPRPPRTAPEPPSAETPAAPAPEAAPPAETPAGTGARGRTFSRDAGRTGARGSASGRDAGTFGRDAASSLRQRQRLRPRRRQHRAAAPRRGTPSDAGRRPSTGDRPVEPAAAGLSRRAARGRPVRCREDSLAIQ